MAKRKPEGASPQQSSRRADDRPLEAGPGAGNEPVVGGGPGKVQDGDLQMRTQGALARGDKQEHQDNISPQPEKPAPRDPHDRLRKIVEAKKAREKTDK